MRPLRTVLAGLLMVGLASAPALAQDEEMPPLPNINWSFNGIFGTFDRPPRSAVSRSIPGLLGLPFDEAAALP